MPDHGNWKKGDSLVEFCKSDGNWDSFQFRIYTTAVAEHIKFQEFRNSCICLDYIHKETLGERIKLFNEVRWNSLTKTDLDYLVAL